MRQMTSPDVMHRPFGKTGLSVPPIVFRADLLDNRARVLPDQTKRLICGEWFDRVSGPVWVEVSYDKVCHECRELSRILRRFEVSRDDVAINLVFDGSGGPSGDNNEIFATAIRDRFEEAEKALGNAYSPKLAMIDVSETQPRDATRAAIGSLAQLKATQRIGAIGIRAKDWAVAKQLSDEVELDFIALMGAFTVLRHPPELAAFLMEIAQRRIAVIAAGVFHGGFLVGGTRFDNRAVGNEAPDDVSLHHWRKAFTSLCHGHGVRPAEACVQFALRGPGVAAVSLSTSRVERVAENLKSTVRNVPVALWESMKEEGLLEDDFRFFS